MSRDETTLTADATTQSPVAPTSAAQPTADAVVRGAVAVTDDVPERGDGAPRPGWGRVVGAAAGTAVVVGVGTALVARVLMRLVADVVDAETGFSVVGTLGIAIVFSVLMVPAAAGGAIEARTRRAVVGLVGVLTTSVVLGWGTATTALVDLADHPLREGRELDLVALLLVGFGATVVVGAVTARRLARRWTLGRGGGGVSGRSLARP